nr:PyzH [Pseudomonas sp. BYT-4]
MAVEKKSRVYAGAADPALHDWKPFQWDEPALGRVETQGEVAIFRPEGTSGRLVAGFWRYHAGAPGANPDGSGTVLSTSPMGDGVWVILDGSATVTANQAGTSHQVGPNSIVHVPKGVEHTWDIAGPYLKTFWVSWDCDNPTGADLNDIYIASTNDNPHSDEWVNYVFNEPLEGELVSGEYITLYPQGSSGTYFTALWRVGKGIPGGDADGTCRVGYTSTLGDETILLLEGEVHIRDDSTGEEFEFRAGDLIALPAGDHITWTAKGPFVKKFSVITGASLTA